MDDPASAAASPELAVELRQFRDRLDGDLKQKCNVDAFYEQFVKLTFRQSEWKEFSISFHFDPPNYPSSRLNVELTSDVLPKKLLSRVQKVCEIEIAKDEKSQALRVLDITSKLLESNRLIACWNEVGKIKKMFPIKENLKISESKGTIRAKMVSGKYFMTVVATVPIGYPRDPLQLRFAGSNFPEFIRVMYESQCNNIIIKLAQGYRPKWVLGEEDIPQQETEKPIELTDKVIQTCKRDVKFLQKQSDLKLLTEDKAMRRKLVRLNKKADAERTEMLKAEADEKAQAQLPTVGPPSRSLERIFEFLSSNWACRLPSELCQACGKAVFPADPKELGRMDSNTEDRHSGKFPERINCGHWFHFKCLDKFLTRPPFGKDCPSCPGHRVTHSLWSSDLKHMEHQWAMKQSRKRELYDSVSEMNLLVGVRNMPFVPFIFFGVYASTGRSTKSVILTFS
eukprot:171152_1